MVSLWKKNTKSVYYSIWLFPIIAIIRTLVCCHVVCEGKFEPYQLNGGLVSAVAGRNYVILASDTRLTDGSYEILTREHLSSRLWSVMPTNNLFLEKDGSLKMPTKKCLAEQNEEEEEKQTNNIVKVPNGMTMIGSAGCAADCEELKRRMRLELMAHSHIGTTTNNNYMEGSQIASPTSVATLLGQTLYSRRVFPYYSFCVLAGLCSTNHVGIVHVYDAIGSHERVAVASAGMGKEMLQPILDQLFSSQQQITSNKEKESSLQQQYQHHLLLRDQGAIEASKQRIGLTTLSPPVQTHVECTLETAIKHLVSAYQSVSERETSVGDTVVLCIITATDDDDDDDKQTQINNMQLLQFPLRSD